ncbi:MAG: extracellular solute-binding protein [Melioribacteraceae bacterium]|nr:extracellular solute-binding protein [Melioribacteraceae bacterium]MCF8265594.1 extracellular solute-binding protein [Melioribacteraceae bacterium]MCF8432354.1 extracellular solute-binding protein [Melioribacteraceae bacterium]
MKKHNKSSWFKPSKFIYLIFLFSLLLLVLIHFVISPQANPESVENKLPVTIYFADNISLAQREIIKRFNSEYNGKIKVELVNLPLEKFSSAERKQLFTKYLRSESNQIDVFSIDQVWIPRFAKWSEDLRKFFPDEIEQNIIGEALTPCIYNNRLVAAPLYIDMGVMYYRSDLISELPNSAILKRTLEKSITWEEFIELGEKYFSDSERFFFFSADNYEGLICFFMEIYSAQNYNSELPIEIGSERTLSSFKFIQSLINENKLTPAEVTNMQETEVLISYLDSDGIFIRGWPNSFNFFEPSEEHKKKIEKIKIVPLPHFKGKPKSYTFGGWNLMLSKFSSNKKEAAEFIKFCLSEESQLLMYEMQGFLPSTKSFYFSDDNSTDSGKIEFFNTNFGYGIYRPRVENYTLFSSILSGSLNKVLRQEIGTDEAILDAEKEFELLSVSNEK